MNEEQRASRPWLPRWAKWLIGVFLIVALVVLTFDALTRRSRRRWEAYAASIRAAGQPLTFAEIEAARPKIPDEKNGALVIEQLAERLEALPGWDDPGTNEWVFYFGKRDEGHDFMTGVAWERIRPSRGFLAQHQDLLDELEKLRDRPTGRYDLPETIDLVEAVLPRLGPTRAAGKLLALRFSVNLFDGNAHVAIEDLRLFSHVTGSLNDHPTIITVLVQQAMDALWMDMVESYLIVFDPSYDQLSALRQLVSERLSANDLTWPLLGERAYLVALFDDYSKLKARLGGTLQSSQADQLPFVPELLARENQIRAVELITALIDAGRNDSAQLAATRRMANELASLSIFYRLTQETETNYSLFVSVELHHRTGGLLRSALAATAAERFRKDHGRFPETLDELIPTYLDTLPIDAFDGKPIKMKQTDLGIVIYSIGENEVDDGGQVEFDDHRRPTDFGIRLLRPEHRGLKLIRVTDDSGPPAEGAGPVEKR